MKLFLGDAFDFLSSLEDCSVDMFLTDPPYGINYKSNSRKKLILPDIDADLDKDLLAKEFYRIAKDNTAHFIFCHWRNMDEWKGAFEQYFTFKNLLVWEKQHWTAGDLCGAFGVKTEFILYFAKGRPLFRKGIKRPHNVLKFNTVGNSRKHLTEKPVDLLEYLIQLFEVSVVCDPFIGVGSTGVACKNLRKEFFGCEINKYYFDIANERLK